MHANNRTLAGFAFGALLSSCSASAQIMETSLAATFGAPMEDVFQVGPGIKMKAVYGLKRNACVLTILGKASDAQVVQIFDNVVPRSVRGKQEHAPSVLCVGTCMRQLVYENVSFSSGTTTLQTSTPAARITFSRPECRRAVAEARKVTTVIEMR